MNWVSALKHFEHLIQGNSRGLWTRDVGKGNEASQCFKTLTVTVDLGDWLVYLVKCQRLKPRTRF